MLVSYQVFTRRDPDMHPILLARQSRASPVRQQGESPVYRSLSAPHGMALNPGLNFKSPGAPKWSRGRDGDLRDIWRQVVQPFEENGPVGKVKICTVLGSESVVEHDTGMFV
jgi:hypothetical protein